MLPRGGARVPVLVLSLLSAFAVLTACTNTPPPPVVGSPAAEPSTPPAQVPSQIIASVDNVTGGYNPHTLADSSTVTSALADLLLPSVFRSDENGTPMLDKALMVSAEVVSQDPFTVAYVIRPDASWSDGAPIAAEDFDFLADAMSSQPGVEKPAGYRLITGVQSREGGKRVEVTFGKPYPAWRTLFDDLLPAHLLKDAPGGWQGALENSFPAYGGPFSIKTVDIARGEIILERNDRYWEKPAAIDRIMLRRTDQPGMAAGLRSGNDQFALATTDATGLQLLGELGPDVQLHTVARPRVASVLLRPVGEKLGDDQVRAAVAALLGRDALIEEGAQSGPSAMLRAGAQVLPPSSPEYQATIPPGPPAQPDPARAKELLDAAGYTLEAGRWQRDGESLSLVIGAPADKGPYADIARELAGQLIAAGIGVRTVTPPARELFTNLLALPVPSETDGAEDTSAGQGAPGTVGVDIAVVGLPAGGDAASTLASTFGCGPEHDAESDESDEPEVPANPAAFCAESLQPTIEAALTGAIQIEEALATLEPELWRRNVVVPLFQLADTLAIGPTVAGVNPGPPLAGPFGSAVNWTRATP